MRVGELAAAAGVSPDTIRHYERAGLLRPASRGANGYREFPKEALERLRIVRAALAVGFTVDELSRILQERDCGGAPCQSVRNLAAAKLARVKAEESELRQLRVALIRIIEDWDERLARRTAGEPVHLLTQLGQRLDAPRPRIARRLRRTSKEKP
jgi:DNA-binding transcriptional MerR regulator